ARLKQTSETWISCIFFVMNLINYRKKASSVSIFWQYLLSLNIICSTKRIYKFIKLISKEIGNSTTLNGHPNLNFYSKAKMIFQ
ncbi:MAG: hypothetical protein ACI9WL_000382, partial [Rubritalea sp.]